MNSLPFGLVLAIAGGLHDVNVPGDLRLAQDREIAPYVQGAFAPVPSCPYLMLFAESSLFLQGNANSPYPHAPIESAWGLGVRVDRGAWFAELFHESTHHVPGAPVFAARQWTGVSAGLRWGTFNLTAPHAPPGY